MDIPVMTIDGPSGVGKGTISMAISRQLGWHFLDSGALYRLLGLAASRHAIDFSNEEAIVTLASYLDVQFKPSQEPGKPCQMLLEGEDVADLIRTEEVGNYASRVAAIPAVREALLGRQRDFLKLPGLVADGRDMGTVVFPEAKLKIFMTASAEERAKRRYKQLIDKGLDANLSGLLAEIEARDKRDRERSVSPLKPADDAILIDTTELGIDEVIGQVSVLCQQRGLII